MTKVLQIRSSGAFLGAERVVIELSKRLPSLGFEPIVGIPLESGGEIPELYHQAKALGVQAELFYCRHPYDLGVIKTIREFVIDSSVSIVHSHGYREDLYALGCKKHAGLIATNHLWKRTDWKLRLYAAIDAYLLRKFQTVIAVSRPILHEMRSKGIASSKTHLIPNGIDVDAYNRSTNAGAIRREFGIDDQAVLLVTISSLSAEKGLNFALDAMATVTEDLPNVHLLIVGAGEELESLKRQTARLNLSSRVTFAGRRQDVADVLGAADVFLLPSLMEGLPMAMLEAMAAGKAVIASDVGDVGAALENNAGILIAPARTEQLTAAIKTLAADTAQLADYGQRAKAAVADKYSSAHMANEYAKHYSQLLAAHREYSYQ